MKGGGPGALQPGSPSFFFPRQWSTKLKVYLPHRISLLSQHILEEKILVARSRRLLRGSSLSFVLLSNKSEPKQEKNIPLFLFIVLLEEVLISMAWARSRCKIWAMSCILLSKLQGPVVPLPMLLEHARTKGGKPPSCPNQGQGSLPCPGGEILNHNNPKDMCICRVAHIKYFEMSCKVPDYHHHLVANNRFPHNYS